MKKLTLILCAALAVGACAKFEAAEPEVIRPEETGEAVPFSYSTQLAEHGPVLFNAYGEVVGWKLDNPFTVYVMKGALNLIIGRRNGENEGDGPPGTVSPGNPGGTLPPPGLVKPTLLLPPGGVGPIGPPTVPPNPIIPPIEFEYPIHITADDIVPTHLYVRMRAVDEEQSATLCSFSQELDLDLFNYPLDYEYRDYSDLETLYLEDEPEYTYTTIPVGQPFPRGMECEILAELFLADDPLVMERFNISELFSDDLVSEALRLTGNEEEAGTASLSGSSKWNPSGRIMAWDDVVNSYIPLEGVKVRARHWFKTRRAITDQDGYFKCDKFKRSVKYAIIWERDHWDIRNGGWGQARTHGPKYKAEWNAFIGYVNNRSKSLGYATIHRALHRHYYGDNKGLTRPSNNRSVKICYHHQKSGTSSFKPFPIIPNAIPDIILYGKEINRNVFRTTDYLYATATHEVAHLSQAKDLGRWTYYWNTDEVIRESWACFVENLLTDTEYKSLGIDNGIHTFVPELFTREEIREFGAPYEVPDQYNLQAWKDIENSSRKYTPLFIDLHDTTNQQEWAIYTNQKDSLDYPNDNITIPDAKLIEEIALSCSNLREVKNKLINSYIGRYGLTEMIINEYFESYNL